LSNALKFTHEGGHVLVKCKLLSKLDHNNNYEEYLQINIRDNGIGIEKEKLPQIFTRFYQAESSARYAGSGIGLALSKSLIELHKGSISVHSEQGIGSEFLITIPVSSLAYEPHEKVEIKSVYESNVHEWINIEFGEMAISGVHTPNGPKSNLLVVDDNLELLHFLKESLSEKFNVHIVENGLDALASMEKNKPDMVISDVMMPGMDGIELTDIIKTSLAYSHIPVILLSAKTDIEQRLEGMSVGADFYISKPFYPHLLIKHIENVLATRQRFIEMYKINLDVSSAEITHSKSDQEFLDKITKIVSDNLDNPHLDVSFLIHELCVSRSLLHLKLKKIVNASTTEFIRSIRLKKAAKMILTGEKSISEVAYATGFSSPSIFSRRFKEYFGKPPSVYAVLKHLDVKKN
jgi:CheY-like chemotaxis protein/AraC-like DNA-binding protein